VSRFEITLRTVTPTFCRGHDQAAAELRAPSLKGNLRWWYRAWHPLAVAEPPLGPWSEARVMGDTTSQGQCPFLLRVETESPVRTITWREYENRAPKGSRDRPGGIRYLGFAFRETKKKEREGESGNGPHQAIAPGTRFKAVHQFRNPIGDEAAKGLVAAWWLFAHLGGLGARSRRGFGSLALERWSWPGREELLRALPLPAEADDVDDWTALYEKGLDSLESWHTTEGSWPRNHPHPHLGRNTTVVLDRQSGWRTADDALEKAGQALAAGRREHRGPLGPVDGRVTLGLPLTTGHRRDREWLPGAYQREPIEPSGRHASPLHLHVGAFRGGFGLCWARLSGPIPGLDPYSVRIKSGGDTIRDQAPNTLDNFVAALDGIRWKPGDRT